MVFTKSLGETCYPFLDRHTRFIDEPRPDLLWHFNLATGQFEKLQHMKQAHSALCSVDYSNNLEGKVLSVAVNEVT